MMSGSKDYHRVQEEAWQRESNFTSTVVLKF